MAIRFRKGRNSRPYQVYWNNPITGKRESQSFTSLAEAKKHDSLIKHRLQYEKESFRPEEESDVQKVKAVTLGMIYLEYLKSKKFDKKGLLWQKHYMMVAIKQLGQFPIEEITRKQLVGLQNSQLQTGLNPVTVKKRMSALRTVFHWAYNNEFCQSTPPFPPLPSGHYKKFVPPTTEELNSILRVAPPHIVRVVFIGSKTGMRIGPCELMQITWEDVDLERRILRVHGSKKNPDAPWREVPIKQSMIELLRYWKEQDMAAGISHLIHFNGKPIQSIKTAWRTALRNAGIERRIRPYDLRHAFASDAIRVGTDIGTVASLMGHSSPTMLLKYYQFVMNIQKEAAVEKLPDLSYVPTFMCPNENPSQPTL